MTAQQIKALRARLNMDRTEFARHLGLASRTSIWRLEEGGQKAKGPLLKLLQILDLQSREASRGKNP